MRLSSFFRHCETVQNFWYFATEWMFKKSQRVPFTFFGTMRLTGNFKKSFEKKFGNFFSQFFVFWELLLSPVVKKVVFESFWALDMAPTWVFPGLFVRNVRFEFTVWRKTVSPILTSAHYTRCLFWTRTVDPYLFCEKDRIYNVLGWPYPLKPYFSIIF